MVLTTSSLRWHYSGGASKSNQDGDQGGTISSVQLTDETLATTPHTKNTLWSNVTSAERQAGRDYYRCLYLKNESGTDTATDVKVYKDSETPAPDDISLGYSGNTASTPEPLSSSAFVNKYTLARSGSSVSALSDLRKGQGLWVTNAADNLLTEPVTKAEFYLKRVGTLTGTLYCRIRAHGENLATATPKATIGTVDVSTIPTADFQKITFANPANSYVMVTNDCIMLEYDGADAVNQIQIARVGNNPLPNSETAAWDGGNWISVSSWDLAGDIWSAGGGGDSVAPAGVTFVNPLNIDNAIQLPSLAPGAYVGLWFRRHIPSACASQSDNGFEISVVFTSPL